MKPFTESKACTSRAFCRACREAPDAYRAPVICPHGITLHNIPQPPRKNMNVIRDTTAVPSEGWQYPGLNGHLIHTHNYSLLYGLVVEHYQSNGAPIPSQQTVIDWMCANLVIPCYESATHEPLVNKFTMGLPAARHSCCGK